MDKRIYLQCVLAIAAMVSCWVLPHAAHAQFTIAFSNADFVTNPQFSNAATFDFTLTVADPLTVGVFNNPVLTSVDYQVNGSLAAGTPSGFPAFALPRTVGGAEFYSQGSSLNFEVAGTADLSDGLQASELVGDFVLNAREVDTGRYHPPVLNFNASGAGVIQNSNNTGATVLNPSSNQLVDVNFGEEYVTNLTFNAANLTIATSSVPEPSSATVLLIALTAASIRRRQHRCG